MTTDAARRAVFNTPELLENIISFVPPTDILSKVQRLSRLWKEAVDSSPAIRGKLWMMVPNTTALQPTYVTNEHCAMPMFPWFNLGTPVYSRTVTFNQVSSFGDSVGTLKIRFNEYPYPGLRNKANGDLADVKEVDLLFCKAIGRPHSPAQMLRSSWRDMYLTNPPITTAVLCVSNYWGYEEHFDRGTIKLSVREHDGLTLGLLYDTLMAVLPSHFREYFASGTNQFVASLYIGQEQVDMGTIGHGRSQHQASTV